MPSRRHFLAASAAAIAAAALPGDVFAQRLGGEVFSDASLLAYARGTLSQTNFESLVGSFFKIFLENDEVAYLRLQTVTGTGDPSIRQGIFQLPVQTPGQTGLTTRGSTPTAPQMTVFHLRFSTGSAPVGQGTYLLESGSLGQFACFLVPGAEGYCTATFAYLGSAPSYLPAHPLPGPVGQPIGIGVANSR